MAIPFFQKRAKKSTKGQGLSFEAKFSFIFSVFLVTIPLLALAATLVYLVYHFRVQHNPILESDFLTPTTLDEPDVYYVLYNATRLTTVASWSSSLGVLLPGYIMTLASFVFVAAIVKYSDLEKIEQLPTAQQLAIALDLKTGSLSALVSSLRYSFSKDREILPKNALSLVILLSISMILGWLTLAADTWLHLTTTTTSFSQVSSVANPSRVYGRAFPSKCLSQGNCIVENDQTAGWSMSNPAEIYNTMNNISANNQIRTTEIDGKRILYLSPVTTQPEVDYRTSTFAIESNCEPITKYCYRNAMSMSLMFNFSCSSGFNTNTTKSSINMESGNPRLFPELYFADSAWTIPVSYTNTFMNMSNPFYTLFQFTEETTNIPGDGMTDQVAQMNEDFIGLSFIMACNTTFYEMNYTVAQNELTQAVIQPISNPILLSNIFECNYLAILDEFVDNAAFLSFLQSTRSAVDQTFSDLYNYVYLGPAASVMTNFTNLAEQITETFLVTRLPKAPFFTLLVCLILSTLYGWIVCLMAMRSKPFRHGPAILQFSTAGVVSSRFEDFNNAHGPAGDSLELFQEKVGRPEKPRIGMTASNTGARKYTSWVPLQPDSKSQRHNSFTNSVPRMKSSREPSFTTHERESSLPSSLPASLHIQYDSNRASTAEDLGHDFQADGSFFSPFHRANDSGDYGIVYIPSETPLLNPASTQKTGPAFNPNQGGKSMGISDGSSIKPVRRKPISGSYNSP